MEVIKSCENNVAIGIEFIVPNENHVEVSSDGSVSNNIVAQHLESVEIEEHLVQRRVSSRIQNLHNVKKRSMSNTCESHLLQKRMKLNHSNSSSTSLLFFNQLDFMGISMIKESLRLANLAKLESEQIHLKRCKKRVAKSLRNSKVDENLVAKKQVPGFTVSKYLLKKLRKLAKLGIDKVHFAQGQVSKAPSISSSLVSMDISNGLEDTVIPVTNDYDDPPVAPPDFIYITSNQVGSNVKIPPKAHGCNCKGNCRNTKTCSCARLNGSVFPYVNHNDGRLIEPRDIIFECGPRCRCEPNCGNKNTQNGLKYQLEVYRTSNKGWAVRTWDIIPSGSPVLEYVGVLNRSDELDNVTENDYIFDIDCWQTINEVEGRERRLRNVSLPTSTSIKKGDDETLESGPEFCIDASSYGSVARFINHSCEPNLFVQCVLSSHLDIRLARVVLFAADDIPPYQELTYDYGYRLDSVIGPDGKIKQLPCYCGAAECRKRLY